MDLHGNDPCSHRLRGERIAFMLEVRWWTAPVLPRVLMGYSHGLKGQRATFLLAVQSGPRFGFGIDADNQPAGRQEVMHAVPAHRAGPQVRSVMRAYFRLSHCCLSWLVVLTGAAPVASRLSGERSADELKDCEWYALRISKSRHPGCKPGALPLS